MERWLLNATLVAVSESSCQMGVSRNLSKYLQLQCKVTPGCGPPAAS